MSLAGKKKYVYAKQTLNNAWEKVLLIHFHNIFPGSAIHMVYDNTEYTHHPDIASITALD
ncbi:hypothetical protein DFH08DRAFT_1081858 [Mycena albidolilacea]|uniref:Glycoside hydrolase family 38 central domain-containing protein n=1 Tax=Mycena albidolilacea TaxID=1033008 RepID=A0AAD6ZW83_9AGAR|nr:hypothetical protein DFH08DRAFT_1081858 [Mycena albidolilacea]